MVEKTAISDLFSFSRYEKTIEWIILKFVLCFIYIFAVPHAEFGRNRSKISVKNACLKSSVLLLFSLCKRGAFEHGTSFFVLTYQFQPNFGNVKNSWILTKNY